MSLSHIPDEFCLKNSGKQKSQEKEGKVERTTWRRNFKIF